MAKQITTLYIDDTSIRLMVARGKRISKLADAPLDMTLAEISNKVKEAELIAKIKQLFKANKVSAKKVIVGLSGLHCLSRPIILPLLPRDMLEEAVIREAQRVLPVPTEQLYITWQVISSTESQMQAFMVAIPRQIADTLIDVMNKLGLKPYIMDIKPLAIARLAQEATAIVIDVQSKEFDIVIMADGVPQPIRTVSFPQETLSLQEKLSIVKDEFKRTVMFFNSNNPEHTIQSDVNIYVSGDGDVPEFFESLADEHGYRVLPLPSPMKCPKQLDFKHHLVNIGLTLKELPKEAGSLLVNLNTLPVPYQHKPISLSKLVAAPAAVAAIGLIILLAMTIQDAAASIDSASSQLEAANFIIEQKQTKKDELMDSITVLEGQLAAKQAKRDIFIAALDGINKEGEAINGDLAAIVDNLVTGISLYTFSYNSNIAGINGNAQSEIQILEYTRNLKDSGRFDGVTINSITRISSDEEELQVEGAEEMQDDEEEIEGDSEDIEDSDSDTMNFTMTIKLKGLE